jgi:ribosome-associated protein
MMRQGTDQPKGSPDRLSKDTLSSPELAILVARILDDLKTEDIVVLDVETVCNFTSCFVIATCTSTPQLRAGSGKVQRDLRAQNRRPIGVAGEDTSTWIVLDYADVVVHLFSDAARDFYRLESLWSDAKPIAWAEEDSA